MDTTLNTSKTSKTSSEYRIYRDSLDMCVYDQPSNSSSQCRECGLYVKSHCVDYNGLCPRCSDVYDQ